MSLRDHFIDFSHQFLGLLFHFVLVLPVSFRHLTVILGPKRSLEQCSSDFVYKNNTV